MVAVRSTEILAVAFEKGYFDGYRNRADEAFHAALYAVRNAGCSITTHELLEYQEVHKPGTAERANAPSPVSRSS